MIFAEKGREGRGSEAGGGRMREKVCNFNSPPLKGEGQGGGVGYDMRARGIHTPPLTPPLRGEGKGGRGNL